MTTLSREARAIIKHWNPGVVTIAGYIREHADVHGRWAGDSCGCPDDRCTDGYHHEPSECQCLRVMLAEFNRKLCRAQAEAFAVELGIEYDPRDSCDAPVRHLFAGPHGECMANGDHWHATALAGGVS